MVRPFWHCMVTVNSVYMRKVVHWAKKVNFAGCFSACQKHRQKCFSACLSGPETEEKCKVRKYKLRSVGFQLYVLPSTKNLLPWVFGPDTGTGTVKGTLAAVLESLDSYSL